MNLKNVEVMENTQNQKQKTSKFFPVAAGALALASGSAANATIETTEVVGAIEGLQGPVAAIGAAVLLILVAIKGWKLIRRAM